MSDTEDRILAAALSCFTELGVEATSIAMIRERAAVSTGSLYHHFENKEGLAAALYLRGVQSFHKVQVSALEQGRPQSVVEALVSGHLRWVEVNPAWARFLLESPRPEASNERVKAVAAALREANRAYAASVVGWFAAQRDAGEIRKLPSELYLPVVLGPAQEFARHWVSGRFRMSPTAAAVELSASAWRSLQTCEVGDDIVGTAGRSFS